MAILTKPSRSYTASVMSSEDSNRRGPAKDRPGKDGIRVYRPPRSEHFAHSHLTHDAHPSSSFAPLPLALQSRKLRKQDREENRQAELNQILESDYSSSGRHSALGHRDSRTSYTAYPGGGSTLGSAAAGPSRLGMGRPGPARPGGLSNSQRTTANGKQTVGVYVDSEGKLHDTEFDPFAGVSQMTRRKSRRRSAFGADRRAGSSTSSSSVSDEEPSGGGDRQREMSRRLESERRRMVGDSDHNSILSHRPSMTGEGAGMAVAARRKSLREEAGRSWGSAALTGSSDDGHSVFVSQQQQAHGRYVPSPLSPTAPNTAATGSSFATATSHLTGHRDRSETPATSTDGDSQPQEKKRQAEPLLSPPSNKGAPRSPSLYASTSGRTSGDRSQYYNETPAQQAAREAVRARSSVDLPRRTPAAAAPSIEIVEDDIVPAHKLQPPPKIRHYAATASPAKSGHPRYALSTHTEDPKPPSTIFDTTNMGYLPSRWASGDREWREGEEAKEKYRPREWGGKHGDLGGREEEWTPSCVEQIKRNWRDLTLATRFGLFRTKKKMLRKADL